MSDTFGVRGAVVARFLDQVRRASTGDWRRYLEPRLGAAVETAVDRAADEAYRSLRLSSDRFPGLEARFIALHTDVITAALVLAAGDTLGPHARQVLLQPLADAGFEAAAHALPGSEPAA